MEWNLNKLFLFCGGLFSTKCCQIETIKAIYPYSVAQFEQSTINKTTLQQCDCMTAHNPFPFSQ